jgi:hypothetical protein
MKRIFCLADTAIACDKLAAYRITHYRVGAGPEAFTLRIDTKSDALLRLYKKTGQTCGLFITACNPFGQAQHAEANEAAHTQLGDCLRALVPHIIGGIGVDPNGTWPGEMSFFALGIDKDIARQLGCRFHQDAVVWAGSEAIPRLLLLR